MPDRPPLHASTLRAIAADTLRQDAPLSVIAAWTRFVAKEHCDWAKADGQSPREVIEAVLGRKYQGEAHWSRAIQIVENYYIAHFLALA